MLAFFFALMPRYRAPTPVRLTYFFEDSIRVVLSFSLAQSLVLMAEAKSHARVPFVKFEEGLRLN